jgi:hypothetical protein
VPKILETPKDPAPDGRDWDVVNLELLRGLARGEDVRPVEFATPTATGNTKTQRGEGPRRRPTATTEAQRHRGGTERAEGKKGKGERRAVKKGAGKATGKAKKAVGKGKKVVVKKGGSR